eukprot:2090350-Prymnesium_polylepis.2
MAEQVSGAWQRLSQRSTAMRTRTSMNSCRLRLVFLTTVPVCEWSTLTCRRARRAAEGGAAEGGVAESGAAEGGAAEGGAAEGGAAEGGAAEGGAAEGGAAEGGAAEGGAAEGGGG